MTIGLEGTTLQCTGTNAGVAGAGAGGGGLGAGAASHVDRLAAGAKRGLIGSGAVVGLGRGDPEREAVTLLRASSHSASRDSVLHTTITLNTTPTPPPLSN